MNSITRRMLRSAPPALVREVEQQGWEASQGAGNHIRWTHPNGAFVFGPLTPGDWRGAMNMASQMKRSRRASR